MFGTLVGLTNRVGRFVVEALTAHGEIILAISPDLAEGCGPSDPPTDHEASIPSIPEPS